MKEPATSPPRRCLITGARAPVALEWARLLTAQGGEVWLADSVPWALARWSRVVTGFWHTPSPRHDPAGFQASIQACVEAHQIDCILPTCEEIFYLESPSPVFAPPLLLLKAVHSKATFIELAQRLGLAVPRTERILNGTWPGRSEGQWWLKPAFSRFAVRGGLDTRDAWHEPDAWVAQEYLEGQEWCAYALAAQGRLVALATYQSKFRAGRGASVAWIQEPHPAIGQWVKQFVHGTDWHGQVAFDFMALADGQVLPLECNPRATSGLHLLTSDASWWGRLWDAELRDVHEPVAGTGAMLALPMLLAKQRQGWWEAWRTSREVIWRGRDPLPFLLGLPLTLLAFSWRAWRRGITFNEALTEDLEWNGN